MTTSTGNFEKIAGRPAVAAAAYEQQLDNDFRWALSEGSRHFDEKSAVFDALRKIVRRLDELQVPYAVVGGMALFKHGFRRFTDDVDVLVRKADLKQIHEKLQGLGYLPAHKQSKHLRDTENGVRIEFLTSGDFPGDGKKKPVAFPDPASVCEEADSIKYINLEKLIELKLASGMTGAGRLRDLADVAELIKLLNLPDAFSERLNPYVRLTYLDLWKQLRRRFVTRLPEASLSATIQSIDDLIEAVPDSAALLADMRRDGVVLERNQDRGYVELVTNDPHIARKYDMLEESELWSDEGEG